MRWPGALLFCALAAFANGGPQLFYSKSFPGSVPAYVEIKLDKSGNGEYREGPNEENPLKFQASESDVAEIFGLVEKLENFARPLESPLKVAFMGMKTFRWQNGTLKNEVKFNYSEDPDAKLLADWFERITETEQHVINLERSAKYDRLGVNKALLLIQISLERKRLIAAQQLLPALDKISKNEAYMHIARQRASSLAETIRASK